MRITIKSLFEQSSDYIGKKAKVAGWVRSVRNSKAFSFIVLNDGSCQKVLQIVADEKIEDYTKVTELLIGSCIEVEGDIVESQGKGQSIEMQALTVHVYGKTDSSYPLQKKATSLEFLREQAHLRPRTNLFGAVFRVRHQLAMATHKFFSDRGFYYLNSPILTAVDAEGAGEMFNVTNMDMANLPKHKDGSVDFSQDYFGKQTSLCVTGQLEGECFAMGMGSVYTFGPTFRAENSNTPRHLSEFWMIEPEVAFMDLEGNAQLASDYVKYLISYAFEHAPDELEALQKYHQFSAKQAKEPYENHLETLEKVKDSEFKVITYTEAIDILSKSNQKFEFKPEWGVELQTEHERYLAEEYFKGPVTVTDYPADCKAFYMKQNDDGKTVRAMDVLVPGVGEIIGGSQREEDISKLIAKMDALGMDKDPLWWYLDLRKFGTAPHSGFGLGFERAIRYITGMKNIRDVIPFPRTPNSCDF
ncbi:MAG: asparagine--tRNA ligase [Halobacteriovoraceae bacterium]|nr:asparagine--tRNA ligase [Halobacteriovoraceae bacterium]|tara:strand:+ start:27555 stop:28973 length:1419 start_codon:yes stop_codon:yes gene_type:complete